MKILDGVPAGWDIQYREQLSSVVGIACPQLPADTIYNHAYFPILVGKEYTLSRDGLYDKLGQHNVFARRYFYPLISDFPMYRGLPSAAASNLPIATKVADQVLCLPIYPDLSDFETRKVISIIQGT